MTHLIGILNVTPDSFSDGGKFNQSEAAMAQAHQLFESGAAWVDVGAESTRPGAETIDLETEWDRMKAFWEAVMSSETLDIKNFTLDTRNPATAEKFLRLGGRVINDVSGFQDPDMVALAFKYGAFCIVNHFPGQTLAEVHEQKISTVDRVKIDLQKRATTLMEQGIKQEAIILDPGIGFGKTSTLNKALLEFAKEVPDWPVLIGHSKKRFLGDDRYEKLPNQKAGQKAIASGAAYLRVHDPEWY